MHRASISCVAIHSCDLLSRWQLIMRHIIELCFMTDNSRWRAYGKIMFHPVDSPFPQLKMLQDIFIITLCDLCVNLLYKTFIFSSLCFCMQAYLSLCESGFLYRLELFLKIMNMLHFYKFHHSSLHLSY